MSSYTIYLSGTVSAAVDVEADSYEEAVERAIDNAPQTDFAFAEFDGVDVWDADDSHMKDGQYVSAASK
ncbi:hypothetical protein AB4Z38_06890 [Arthrobacter sp. 2RAF6]|uniref:hypothetical protein n=1 Tax=Arthrobacter sp. 2RAF6 TaxID=3233002 RepID=UPI003F906A47